ncbi:MAG: hypothetical protein WAV90_04715 [Gordonia amarae]
MVRKNRRGAKWMMIHIALIVAWLLGFSFLGAGAAALLEVGWEERWTVAADAQLTGAVVLAIAALYVAFVVPIHITRFTGREVLGGDGGGGGGGGFSGGGDCGGGGGCG